MRFEAAGGPPMGGNATAPVRAVPVFLMVTVALCGFGVVLPGAAGVVCFEVVQFALVAALVFGIHHNKPAPRWPWTLLSVGISTLALANAVWGVFWFFGSRPNGVGIGDGAALLGYIPAVIGLAGMARLRRPRHDMSDVIDGALLAGTVAFLSWQIIVEPHVSSDQVSVLGHVAATAYPVCDAVLLVVATRLARNARERVIAWWLILLGLVLALPIDIIHAIALQQSTSETLWRLQSLAVVARLFIGAAALHPSMRRLSEPSREAPEEVSARAALLLVPLLTGPVLLLFDKRLQLDGRAQLVAALSLVMAVIVVLRLSQLAREVSTAREREQGQERWFESLVRNAKDTAVVIDANGTITWVSPGIEHLMGYSTHEIVGRPVTDFVVPEHHDSGVEAIGELVSTSGATAEWQFRVRTADGETRRLDAHAVNLLDDPHVRGIVVNQRDITDWHRADIAVRHRAAQQEAVAELSQRALVGADPVELSEDAVRIIATHLDVEVAQFFRASPTSSMLLLEALAISPEHAPEQDPIGLHTLPTGVGTLAEFTLAAGTPVISGASGTEDRFEIPAIDGVAPFDATMSVAVTGRHAPHGVIVIHTFDARTFSAADALFLQAVANALALALERRNAEDQTKHQALHDTLTGLPNRALFLDRLHLALARAQRTRAGIGVLFLDLDHFKVVNDSLGHDAGDRLLMAVAQRLTGILRPGDTVARFGGDEFTILCEGLANTAEAIDIAERINELLATPLRVGPAEMHTTASIGIAITNGQSARPESLLRDADAAMYRAKEHGRARYELFDATMRDRALTRLRTETSLRRALGSDEFELYYQPVVDLRHGTTVGAEALIRWNSPERGLVMPDEFIPVAEETGLIDSLGEWVLDNACRQIAQWTREASPTTHQPLVVGVNVSARGLTNPHFFSTVRRCIEDHEIDPSYLCLEITESVLMGNVEVSLTSLRRLKDLGLAIAVDDFGTGYSSLAYLKRFPVDVLKVDRSFVDGLGRESEDSAICEAVISLARTLGLIAIAEGVESSLQVAELTSLECDLAQGYFYASPVPASHFAIFGPPPGTPPSTSSFRNPDR